jgi:gas vesicle protein
MGMFKKGMVFGGLVGAGITWLNTTVRGKKVRDDLIVHAASAYKQLKAELKSSETWKDLSEHEYTQKVTAFVDTYSKKHKLDGKAKVLITKLVVSQWARFKQEDTK